MGAAKDEGREEDMGDLQRVNSDEGKKRGIAPDPVTGQADVRGRNPLDEHNTFRLFLDTSYQPTLNQWSQICHQASVDGGWWHELDGVTRKERNPGEMFMLMVTELAEAYNEGVRKGLMDKHLTHRTAVEVELADELIRIFDFAGHNNLDLDGAVREKMAYNEIRQDHKLENRLKDGGKKV